MNALAGGGSFVTLPALIAAGVPSVQANASSTVALVPGGLASAWAYRDGLRPIAAASIASLLLTTLAGGVIGALLLLWTPTRMFDVVLPWLLLLATLALIFGRQLGERLAGRWRARPALVLAFQLVLSIYGGYYGGAVGLMMTAVWGLLDGGDVKSLNASRTLLATTANATASITFLAAGAVHWRETVVMLIAATAGGYSGAQIGRRASPELIRYTTLVIASAITLAFFARAYR